MTRRTAIAWWAAILIASGQGTVVAQVATPKPLATQVWDVEGTKRRALVYIPAKPEGAPVVFVWHGHGGRMDYIAAAYRAEKSWPEAVVVYPQGLPTRGRVNDPEGKQAGWQFDVEQYGDRDLKFFDAMLDTLGRDHKADVRRVYTTGHSNGGRFSYLLWSVRPDRIAAVAPVASPAVERFDRLEPRPCFHVAGRNDPIAGYDGQRAGMERAKANNGCEAEGRPWGDEGRAIFFPSSKHAPFVEYVHDGGHEIPADAPAMIVDFFKEIGR